MGVFQSAHRVLAEAILFDVVGRSVHAKREAFGGASEWEIRLVQTQLNGMVLLALANIMIVRMIEPCKTV